MRVHPGSRDRDQSYERARVERAHFERHSDRFRFEPSHRVFLKSIRIVPTTYYYRRTVFYDTYGWSAPAYVYGFYPRYGLWDTVFLAFMLDHIYEDQYALMFYHHRHDAEIQQWMDDNDRLAEENADLRDRLDAMRSRMDQYDRDGLTEDQNYVPADAQDLALSPEVIDQLTKDR
jgi:hypothetical protein